MTSSDELTRYGLWSLAACSGAALAACDWYWLRRPVFGIALLLILVAGYATTLLSPFNFVDGGYYMNGVIAFVIAGLALAGYIALSALAFLASRLKEGRKP